MAVLQYTVTREQRARIHGDRLRTLGAIKRRAIRRVIEKHRGQAARRTPVDTGLTRASWEVQTSETAYDLVNTAPHFAIIELGRRPGRWPPGDYQPGRMLTGGPIFDWAWRVLRPRLGRAKNRFEATARAAWYIARKIGTKGIRPRYVIRPMLKRWADDVARAVEAESR